MGLFQFVVMKINVIKEHSGYPKGINEVSDERGKYLISMKVAEEAIVETNETDGTNLGANEDNEPAAGGQAIDDDAEPVNTESDDDKDNEEDDNEEDGVTDTEDAGPNPPEKIKAKRGPKPKEKAEGVKHTHKKEI